MLYQGAGLLATVPVTLAARIEGDEQWKQPVTGPVAMKEETGHRTGRDDGRNRSPDRSRRWKKPVVGTTEARLFRGDRSP